MYRFKYDQRPTLEIAQEQGKKPQVVLFGFVAAVGFVGLGLGVGMAVFGGSAPSGPSTAQQIAALAAPATTEPDRNVGQTERRGIRYQPASDGVAPAPRPENLPAPVVVAAATAPPTPVADPLADISLPDLEGLVTRSIGSVASEPLAAPVAAPAAPAAPAPAMDQLAPVIADVATALTAQPAPAPAVSAAPALAPQPVAAPVPEIPICVEQLAILSQATVIPFDLAATAPAPQDLELLRRAAQVLAQCDGLVMAIEGHSDASGSDLQNISLSWQRAETTIALLAAEGYDTSRMEPMGFGARRLLDTSGTPAADALNRRVTVRIAPAPGSDLAALFQQ